MTDYEIRNKAKPFLKQDFFTGENWFDSAGFVRMLQTEQQKVWKEIIEKSFAQVNLQTLRKCLLIDESDLIRMGECLGM